MRKWRLMSASFLAAAIFAACTPSLRAQALADHLPPDAIAYAGWAGSDAMGQAYDASHLKAFINTLNLPEFITQVIQSEAAKQADPQKIEDGKLIAAWLAAMAKAPTAVYVGPVDVTDIQKPVPHVAIVSKVGKATATELAEKLDILLHRNNTPDAPPHGVHVVGDYLLLFTPDAAIEPLLEKAPADNLAASPVFKRAMAQVNGDASTAAAWIYVDLERGMKIVDQAVKQSPNPQTQQMVPIVLEGMGVPSLNQVAWSGSFDGPNWRSDGFIGMKEKRNGLLIFLDHPALTESAYTMIPQSATAAGVIRWDGQRLISEMQDVAKHINERAPQQLDLIFQQIYAFSGIDVKNDLAPAFGDEFVWYGAPAAAGNSLRGLTIVNKLRDPQKAETALTALESIINLSIVQRDPTSKAQFRIDTLPAPLDKVTAHVMALDTVTPAWAIHNGVFYFSLSLAGLQSAIEQVNAPAGEKRTNLLTNPGFAALQKKIGHADNFSFAYADLAASAPEAYELFSRALAQAMERNPEHPYALPPLDKLQPDLGPLLMVAWSDKDGFHNRELAPFPGAEFLSPTQLLFLRIGELVRNRVAPNGAPAGGAGGAGALP